MRQYHFQCSDIFMQRALRESDKVQWIESFPTELRNGIVFFIEGEIC